MRLVRLGWGKTGERLYLGLTGLTQYYDVKKNKKFNRVTKDKVKVKRKVKERT